MVAVVTKPCVVCGTSFTTRSRSPQRERYCGPRCYAKFWNDKTNERRHPRGDRTRVCVICGKQFTSPVFRPKALTCSQPCNAQRQNQRRRELKLRHWKPSTEVRHCVQCGAAYTPKKYGAERQRFCVEKCRADWNRARYVLKHGNAKITERHKKRKWGGNWWAAVERDGRRCVVCRIEPPEFHVHHLDGTGETDTPNHELANLVTLCAPCHRIVHAVSYRISGDRLFVRAPAFKLLGWSEEISVPLAQLTK